MSVPGVLIVLRGNSGSGKSTVAALIQSRLPEGQCLLVSQDAVRRGMLGEHDVAGASNIELVELIAGWGLERGLFVIVDGILHTGRYGPMLERLQSRSGAAHFFAWDLTFEETARRHQHRVQRSSFTVDEMRSWFHGWQPLDFTTEVRFDQAMSADRAADAVLERAMNGVVHAAPRRQPCDVGDGEPQLSDSYAAGIITDTDGPAYPGSLQ